MFKNGKKILTIKLSKRAYEILDGLSFAKKKVPKGSWTDTHYHKFFSAYLTKNMEALKLDQGGIPMPKYALVIVLPFVNHTWTNEKGNTDDCCVSDLSPAHGEHTVYN